MGTLELTSAPPTHMQAAVTLELALVASLINWFAVEPITTRLMFER